MAGVDQHAALLALPVQCQLLTHVQPARATTRELLSAGQFWLLGSLSAKRC